MLAVAAMLDIALRTTQGPVTLLDVGRRQRISQTNLELMFKALRSSGLVLSTRGPGGGYQLARSADSISVGEIVWAVDGNREQTQEDHPSVERAIAIELDGEVAATAHQYLSVIALSALTHLQRDPGLRIRRANHQSTTAVDGGIDLSGVPNSVFALASKLRP